MFNRFLLATCAFVLASSAYAQTEKSLFPDLEKKVVQEESVMQPQKEVKEVPSLFGSAPVSETDEMDSVDTGDTFAKEDTVLVPVPSSDNATNAGLGNAPSNNQSKQKSGNFDIYVHDLQIVVPAVKSMQFCLGQISLENGTDTDLKGIKLVFKYGDMAYPYTFAGVKPGEITTGKVAMGGPACQELLKVPTYDVSLCVADKMTQEECIGKIKYILK